MTRNSSRPHYNYFSGPGQGVYGVIYLNLQGKVDYLNANFFKFRYTHCMKPIALPMGSAELQCTKSQKSTAGYCNKPPVHPQVRLNPFSVVCGGADSPDPLRHLDLTVRVSPHPPPVSRSRTTSVNTVSIAVSRVRSPMRRYVFAEARSILRSRFIGFNYSTRK